VNLALPGLIIILGIIPGIVFWNTYFSGTFPKQAAGISPVLELAQYVLFAIPLDALGIIALNVLGSSLSLDTAIRLLTGTVTDVRVPALTASLRSGWPISLGVYVGLIAFSFCSAALMRQIVWATRLDVHLPLFKMKNRWYYPLQGRGSGLPRWYMAPYADVLAEHPGEKSRLYRGLVEDFELAKDGSIKALTLTDADRGKGRGDDFKWIPIPGDQLIIMGERIHSINMRYVHIEARSVYPDRKLLGTRLFLRSLFLQEP
jgi:hypothetical protein